MEWVLILYFPLLADGSILFCRMNILAIGFAIRKNPRSSSFVAGQRYFSTFFMCFFDELSKTVHSILFIVCIFLRVSRKNGIF